MTKAEPCMTCGLQSELGQAACYRLMHYCTQAELYKDQIKLPKASNTTEES